MNCSGISHHKMVTFSGQEIIMHCGITFWLNHLSDQCCICANTKNYYYVPHALNKHILHALNKHIPYALNKHIPYALNKHTE